MRPKVAGKSWGEDVVHRAGFTVGERLRGKLQREASGTSCWSGKRSTRCSRPRCSIERWRQHNNTIRPHSALGYGPPAPEARQPCAVASATAQGWSVGGQNPNLKTGVIHGGMSLSPRRKRCLRSHLLFRPWIWSRVPRPTLRLRRKTGAVQRNFRWGRLPACHMRCLPCPCLPWGSPPACRNASLRLALPSHNPTAPFNPPKNCRDSKSPAPRHERHHSRPAAQPQPCPTQPGQTSDGGWAQDVVRFTRPQDL